MFEATLFDLRYACRVLRRAPRNSLIAVAILGLGIGANTTMFTALSHVLVRPLPFSDPDRLVRMRDMTVGVDGQAHAFNMIPAHVIAVRQYAGVFADSVAFSGGSMAMGGDLPERVSVIAVSDT